MRRFTSGRASTGLEVSEAKRLRALETENAKLKRLLADAMLDNAALKGSAPASSWSRTASGMRGSLRRGIVELLSSDHAQPPHEIPDSPPATGKCLHYYFYSIWCSARRPSSNRSMNSFPDRPS